MATTHNPQQIVSRAVQAMSDLVDDTGCSPTDALIKVAEEQKLTPGYTRLAGQAWNVGSQRAQQKQAESLEDLLAPFELADPSAAIEHIWGDASTKTTSKVASVYASRDKSWIKTLTSSSTVKAASTVVPAESPEPQLSVRDRFEQFRQNRADIKTAEAAVRQAELDLSQSIGNLCRFFKKSAEATAKLESYCKTAERFWNDDVEMPALFEYVRNETKYLQNWTKQAQLMPLAVDLDEAPWSLLQAIVEKSAAQRAAVDNAELVRRTKEAENTELMRPFGGRPDQTPAEKAASLAAYLKAREWSSLIDKEAAVPPGPKPLPKTPTPKPPTPPRTPAPSLKELANSWNPLPDKSKDTLALEEPAVAKFYQQMVHPSHVDELKRVRTEALLHGLMANDEIIGSYDPDEVLRQYNELAQLAPAMASQPALMRAALRQQLASHSGVAETSALVNVGRNLPTATFDPERAGVPPKRKANEKSKDKDKS